MEAVERKPDVFGVHSGSIDLGPYYLGAGIPYYRWQMIKKGLESILAPTMQADVPVIISGMACGGRPYDKLFLATVDRELRRRRWIIHKKLEQCNILIAANARPN
ncbi:MAG: hypothetical protein ABSF09_12990 [Candidatus Bathyarchaeia archaeon]|jgi:hypothetical protein